jgi:glutaminase
MSTPLRCRLRNATLRWRTFLELSGALRKPPEEVVEVYTRQCSLKVTAGQLSAMGATMANIGTNPMTENAVVGPLAVRHTLAVMFTSGMYNYAGRWAVDVGVPAKSGVSGGVLAVVNRQIGIASYSPRLDARGNSVRGIQASVQLAEELGLHKGYLPIGPRMSPRQFCLVHRQSPVTPVTLGIFMRTPGGGTQDFQLDLPSPR